MLQLSRGIASKFFLIITAFVLLGLAGTARADTWNFDHPYPYAANQGIAAANCAASLQAFIDGVHKTFGPNKEVHVEYNCVFDQNSTGAYDSDHLAGYFYDAWYVDIYASHLVGKFHWNGPTCYPPNFPGTDGSCNPQSGSPNAGSGGGGGGGGSPPNCPDNGCGNPINTATGNKYQLEADFVGSDLLRFERSYNSDATAPSHLLGPHWVNTYHRRVETVSSTMVILWRPDGAGFGLNLVNGVWTPPSGVLTRLTRLVDGNGNLAGWTYTEQDAREVENYDALGRLVSIVRSNGQSVALVYNYGVISSGPNDYLPTSVTDQSGRKLSLSYSGQKLTQLVDPTGAAYTYGYDASGRLSVVTYPGGAAKTYLYNEPAYTGGNSLPNALTGIVDEKNQRFATFGYQADGRAVSTEHAGQVQKYTMVYNSDGTTTITKPSGVVQQRGFNRATTIQRTSSISEIGNGQTRTSAYTFNAAGHVDIATDAAGTTRDFDENSRGLVTQLVESANVAATKRTTQTDWDPSFNVPTERRLLDASGMLESKSTLTYNARGQAMTSTQINLSDSALSRTTTFTYCEQAGVTAGTCPRIGLLISVDGPRTDVADTTIYTYRQADDSTCASIPTSCPYRKGDLWKVTNALGQVTEFVKSDGAGRPLSVKDANGVITDLEYNGRGWLTARKVRGTDNASETDDAIARNEFDSAGLVTKVIEPDGAFTSFGYDAAHRLTDITDPLGNTTRYTLNSSGDRIQEDSKNSSSVVMRSLSRIYNLLGELQTVADAQSTPTDFTYDINGYLNTITDPLLRVTDRDVDAIGRVKQVIANTGGGASDKAISQFQYDSRDNLRTVVDPKGLSTSYSYDSLNNLIQLSSPDTGTTTYGFDTAGNRTGEMKADGNTEGFVYDALNRLSAKTYTQSSQNNSLIYDSAQPDCAVGEKYSVGRLTKITDPFGSIRFCYDLRGNLVRKVQTVSVSGKSMTFSVGSTFNAAGRVVAMTYPSGAVVTYLRDAAGRISRVDAKSTPTSAQVTIVSAATYLPFGPVTTLTFGNGRVLTKAYDRNYQIDSVTDSALVNPMSEDFTVDSVGHVTGLVERTTASATVSRTYTYDGLDRLTAQKNGTTTVEGFTYNSTGDRLSKTAGSTTNYTYAATDHRLKSVGSALRSYTAVGETHAIGSSLKVTFNAHHRLTAGLVPNFSYTYNGLGQRVRKQPGCCGVPATRFVYDDAGHLIGEYDDSGMRAKEYVWLDDTLVAVLSNFDGSEYQYVETDQLNTPRAVVHPSKNTIIWRWDVNPTAFGEHAPSENPDGDSLSFNMNLRFPGQYFDVETGLFYNYFRDYDPTTGRYLESDPIGLRGGVSSYAYSGANALAATDFYGLNYWTGNLAYGQFGKSIWWGLVSGTAQGFTLGLEMPIGKCDFYGKRYRLSLESSKEFVSEERPFFASDARVTFNDGNEAFEPGALLGPFSLDVSQGSQSGTLRMGSSNRVAQVGFSMSAPKGGIHMTGELNYQTVAASHGQEEMQCGCDKPATPAYQPNGSWRDLDN
jgi:RHS repeat-associated protein